jgi:hypothetical protein
MDRKMNLLNRIPYAQQAAQQDSGAALQQNYGGGTYEGIMQAAGLTPEMMTPELEQQIRNIQNLYKQYESKGWSGDKGDLNYALQALRATGGMVSGQNRPLEPYSQAGQSALEQQMALLGLRGGDAMNAAYMMNPAQQFERDQAEQALIRNRAVTGGLGNEGMSEALVRLQSGLTNQNIMNQLGALGGLSGMGANVAGRQSGIIGQQIADSWGMQMGLKGLAAQQAAARNAQGGTLGKVADVVDIGGSLAKTMGWGGYGG